MAPLLAALLFFSSALYVTAQEKAGLCPLIAPSSPSSCNSDADCTGDKKCCTYDRNQRCADPVIPNYQASFYITGLPQVNNENNHIISYVEDTFEDAGTIADIEVERFGTCVRVFLSLHTDSEVLVDVKMIALERDPVNIDNFSGGPFHIISRRNDTLCPDAIANFNARLYILGVNGSATPSQAKDVLDTAIGNVGKGWQFGAQEVGECLEIFLEAVLTAEEEVTVSGVLDDLEQKGITLVTNSPTLKVTSSNDEAASCFESFFQNDCDAGKRFCPYRKHCILETAFCDGNNDCGDFSDEQNCNFEKYAVNVTLEFAWNAQLQDTKGTAYANFKSAVETYVNNAFLPLSNYSHTRVLRFGPTDDSKLSLALDIVFKGHLDARQVLQKQADILAGGIVYGMISIAVRSIEKAATGPCVNHACGEGLCVEANDNAHCRCSPGQDPDSCVPIDCRGVDDYCGANNTKGCVYTPRLSGYSCQCPQGFAGTHCDIDVCGQLGGSVCSVNGQCVGDLYDFTLCSCQTFFRGPFCEDRGGAAAATLCERQSQLTNRFLQHLNGSVQVNQDFLNGNSLPQQLDLLGFTQLEVSTCNNQGQYHHICVYNITNIAAAHVCYCTNADGTYNGLDYNDGVCGSPNNFDPDEKPGVCPTVDMGIAIMECREDRECEGDKKCCRIGAGRQCKAPITEPPRRHGFRDSDRPSGVVMKPWRPGKKTITQTETRPRETTQPDSGAVSDFLWMLFGTILKTEKNGATERDRYMLGTKTHSSSLKTDRMTSTVRGRDKDAWILDTDLTQLLKDTADVEQKLVSLNPTQQSQRSTQPEARKRTSDSHKQHAESMWNDVIDPNDVRNPNDVIDANNAIYPHDVMNAPVAYFTMPEQDSAASKPQTKEKHGARYKRQLPKEWLRIPPTEGSNVNMRPGQGGFLPSGPSIIQTIGQGGRIPAAGGDGEETKKLEQGQQNQPDRPQRPQIPNRPGRPTLGGEEDKKDQEQPGRPTLPTRPQRPQIPNRPGRPTLGGEEDKKDQGQPGRPTLPTRPQRPQIPNRPGRPTLGGEEDKKDQEQPGRPTLPTRPERPQIPNRPGRPTLPNTGGNEKPERPGRPTLPTIPGGGGGKDEDKKPVLPERPVRPPRPGQPGSEDKEKEDKEKEEKEKEDREKEQGPNGGKPVIRPVRPVKPVRPVRPIRPVRPLRPVRPVRPKGKPVRPVRPVRPGGNKPVGAKNITTTVKPGKDTLTTTTTTPSLTTTTTVPRSGHNDTGHGAKGNATTASPDQNVTDHPHGMQNSTAHANHTFSTTSSTPWPGYNHTVYNGSHSGLNVSTVWPYNTTPAHNGSQHHNHSVGNGTESTTHARDSMHENHDHSMHEDHTVHEDHWSHFDTTTGAPLVTRIPGSPDNSSNSTFSMSSHNGTVVTASRTANTTTKTMTTTLGSTAIKSNTTTSGHGANVTTTITTTLTSGNVSSVIRTVTRGDMTVTSITIGNQTVRISNQGQGVPEVSVEGGRRKRRSTVQG